MQLGRASIRGTILVYRVCCQWGYDTCKINRDWLVFAQITNHCPARIAESSRPQQGARPITISATSGTSDRSSLAPPAASRLCASRKSTAIFRANTWHLTKEETRRTTLLRRDPFVGRTADHRSSHFALVALMGHARWRSLDTTNAAILDRSANAPLRQH